MIYSIADDLEVVLTRANRLGVAHERLEAIRAGNRRQCLALLGAIIQADHGRSIRWAGVVLRAPEVAPAQAAALRLFALVAFLSQPGFRQVVRYGGA